jgi:hypothetical protein
VKTSSSFCSLVRTSRGLIQETSPGLNLSRRLLLEISAQGYGSLIIWEIQMYKDSVYICQGPAAFLHYIFCVLAKLLNCKEAKKGDYVATRYSCMENGHSISTLGRRTNKQGWIHGQRYSSLSFLSGSQSSKLITTVCKWLHLQTISLQR